MPNLIESLIAGAVQRSDAQRLGTNRRPSPVRTRDVLDLFTTMGRNATLAGLFRSIDFKDADPRTLGFAVLGRWLTQKELAALPVPYLPSNHFKRLILSQEFRGNLARLVFDTFPEKQRMLFVRLPRCAGQHAMTALRQVHPVLEPDFADPRYRDPDIFVSLFGNIARLFASTRTIAIALPEMAPFIGVPTTKRNGPDPLNWSFSQPPCRATDLLFTILRPPADLALSEVNGVLTVLRGGGDAMPLASSLRAELGSLPPPDDIPSWREVGRRILSDVVSQNPVCRALGDGTAEGALAACARVPIQLVGMARYDEWSRIAFGVVSPDPENVSEPILRSEDLTAQGKTLIEASIAEDRIFYARFEKRWIDADIPSISAFNL